MNKRAAEHTAKVNLISFGKITMPPVSPKYIIDVSTLRDPSCQFAKIATDGRNPDIRAWIRMDPRVSIIIGAVKQLLAVHIDSMHESYLSIGFRDHHGKWISPCIAEIVADEIELDYPVSVNHKELK